MNSLKFRNLTILLGSTLIVGAGTIINPVLPQMAEAFADVPNSEFLVRLSFTMPGLFIAIGALFAGLMLDRLGRKPVIISGLLLFAFSGVAGYFLDTLPAILASRALLGLAVAGIMSGFTTLVLDCFEGEELNKFLGLQGAFIGLGGMFFLLMAGYMAVFGWRYPFLIHLLALLILPGVIFFIKEPQIQAAAAVMEGERISFPWRKLLPIYATGFISMAIFYFYPVQVPFYLASTSNVTTSQVGLALSLQTLVSVFVALQYQRLKSHYSYLALFGLVFLAYAFNLFILSLSPLYLIVIAGLLIGGVGIGLFPPASNGWLASQTPPELRGKAVGGLTSAVFLGQFMSPIIAQPAVTAFGFRGTFLLAGAVSFLIALGFMIKAIRGREPAQIAATT